MSILLLGKIGTGKTTFYNKITLSQEPVKSGGDSVTQSVFMKNSAFGRGFSILDTPGFGSYSKKMDQIASVLCALSEGPISSICITVKFERTDIITEDIKQIIRAFYKYKDLITVIITFWDLCEQNEKEANKKNIQQRIHKYNIKSVIFVSKNDTSESICQQMDQIIARSQAENVQLDEKDIFENFDMIEYDDATIQEINYSSGDLIQEYHKFFLQATKEILNTNISRGLLADYCYAITQFAKQKLDDTIKGFQKKNQQDIDNLCENEQFKAFQIYYQLKSKLFKEYEYIVEAAQNKINNGNQFSKYIKRCNYCKEIWLKVSGCEGLTVCGRLTEDHIDDFIQKEEPPQNYIVTYKQGKLEVKPNELKKPKSIVLNEQNKQNLMTNEEKAKTETIKLDVFEKAKVGGIGCRQKICWDQMLLLTEEELIHIFKNLDEKFQEEIKVLEDEEKKKKLSLQMSFKGELEKKIIEQKQMIKKAI